MPDTKHLPTPEIPITSLLPLHISALRAQNQLHSPLLRLPQELLDLIIPHTLPTNFNSHFNSNSHHNPPPLPPLLQVSSHLRLSTAKIFYAHHPILLAGAPSPQYEKRVFANFDPVHKTFIRRVHWAWESYGTREQARTRAGELERLLGLGVGVCTVGVIVDCFGVGKEGGHDGGGGDDYDDEDAVGVDGVGGWGRRRRKIWIVDSRGEVR